MTTLPQIMRRLRRLVGLRRAESEMAEEMRFHLEQRTADFGADGLDAAAAAEAAQRKFGNLASIQEHARDAHRWTGVESVARDVRFALRYWQRFPGFTTVAILTLAVGIGANTAIFSLIDSLVLRPLPYPHFEHLRQLWTRNEVIGSYPVANGAAVRQWNDHATTVDVAAISDQLSMNLIERGSAENVSGAAVSINYLELLGLQPGRGRDFQRGDDVAGPASHVVILTHEWWQARFGGDPSILHRPINLHQRSYTVVGILPPRALAQDHVRFLVPIAWEDDGGWRLREAFVTPIVRLKPGVTELEATRELEALTRELEQRQRPAVPTTGHTLEPLQMLLVGPDPPPYGLLLSAVGVVLLIVCVNLATLLLARGTVRQKEVAIRGALGAGSGRIVRQMLTESLVLAFAGGLAGVALAIFGIDVLGRMLAGNVPAMLRPGIDWRVLVFTLAATVGTSVLFGLVPALQSRRVDVQRNLKDEGHGSTSRSRSRTLAVLIVAEIALTVLLLTCAGLLGRSFLQLLQIDVGFEPRLVLTGDIALTPGAFADHGAVQFQRDLTRELERLPGVVAVGTSTTLPLRNERWYTNARRSGAAETEPYVAAGRDFVGGNYFRSMGMTLLRGRWLDERDQTLDAPRTVVVTPALAELFWPGENPLGQRVHFDEAEWEVVGLAKDVRYENPEMEAPPRIYAAHVHHVWNVRLVIRTTAHPLSLVPAIRRTLAAVDGNHSVTNFRTLDDAFDQALQRRRGALHLVSAFAIVALMLAAMGVYGVIGYTIAQRQREFAIRLALGAESQRILRHALRYGMRLTVMGVAVGMVVALWGTQMLAAQLYQVHVRDPRVLVFAGITVTAIALLATLIPARRAARTDVLQVLRGG